MKRVAICGLMVGVLVALAGCDVIGGTPGEWTPVTVMLDWTPNTNHTGLYVAQAQGWYRDQGLDVRIIEPAQENTVVQVVAAGQADFGISYQEEVTIARSQDVPVVSIAAIIQHNTSGFASPRAKGLTQPRDFQGKKYGAFGSPMEKAVLGALMACDGADVNTVEFVDVGWADYFLVTQRDVDFTWIFYGWTGIEAQVRGEPLNIIMLSDWVQCVPDYYTPVIIASEQTVAQRQDVARRFMAATSQGYRYAIEHPAEAADMLLQAAPESNAGLVRQSQQWLSPRYQADAARWGEQKAEVWQRYVDWMADQGLIARRIDPAQAFTTEFLP
ncbi:MAG: ABC transporter substrate-binding protein [Chloroflexi bacterium]|nr:ABC transporter substrate-binding protein [Chloroflexota bacterium]MBU1749071.1 ABC transporter substrate-binding protein [Chloroflexota bacterium]